MMSQKLALFCLLSWGFLIKLSTALSPSPIVNTPAGPIRGLVADDGDYYKYVGIPYAKVNMSNPFGLATPQEPFEDVFDAVDDSVMCPQLGGTSGALVDCLQLNVFAPTTATPNNPMPVMVMIHGGGFFIGYKGQSMYGAKFLVRHDVLLVTINYRLGPYGFMCLDIPEVPGNAGLKDQLLALRWVKDNIEAFGGDPNDITAFGNSAGGVSVDFHILSPHEKLFNKGILQSGTSMLPMFGPPNYEAPLVLAGVLGSPTNNVYEAIEFLAGIDANVLIFMSLLSGLFFTPCVEKQFDGVESFLGEDWIRAPMPKVADMPLMVGFTDQESLGSYHGLMGTIEDDLIRGTTSNAFNSSDPRFDGMADLAHRFYLGDDPLSLNGAWELLNFSSDITFNYPALRAIHKALDNGAGDIFLYVFSYIGERNYVREAVNVDSSIGGAAHSDEQAYLFDFAMYGTPNAADQLMIDRITTLWANFAKYGNPTPQTSQLLPVLWNPVTNDTFYHLDLNSELTLGARPFHERMAFWELFYRANADIETPFGY